ncbi:MAG: glycosyltransferase, partial [Anaerolineae bacterium]|nr:glycosyltransferase [Anaerolineae bacterium]
MAVYNGEDFIAEALDSIILQAYTPMEIVVVDDGSTD